MTSVYYLTVSWGRESGKFLLCSGPGKAEIKVSAAFFCSSHSSPRLTCGGGRTQFLGVAGLKSRFARQLSAGAPLSPWRLEFLTM